MHLSRQNRLTFSPVLLDATYFYAIILLYEYVQLSVAEVMCRCWLCLLFHVISISCSPTKHIIIFVAWEEKLLKTLLWVDTRSQHTIRWVGLTEIRFATIKRTWLSIDVMGVIIHHMLAQTSGNKKIPNMLSIFLNQWKCAELDRRRAALLYKSYVAVVTSL